jgi:hypothetical protein
MQWVPDRTGRFSRRPHYLPAELDDECEQLILAFLRKRYGKVEFPIATDDLTVLIEERADLDSCTDLSDEGGDVEGVTEFVPGRRPTVRISDSLSQTHLENRLRTTLTHEYGHVHFHQFMFADADMLAPSLFSQAGQGHMNKCHRDNIVAASERDWMEWQAGYACGAILMPTGALVDAVKHFRGEEHIPYSNITLQSDEGQRLVVAISKKFQTSKDAARVRLLKKGIVAARGTQVTAELF